MTQPAPVVFLLDVDNTLLDNDRVTADLQRHLTQAFGAERQERYWAILEERRGHAATRITWRPLRYREKIRTTTLRHVCCTCWSTCSPIACTPARWK